MLLKAEKARITVGGKTIALGSLGDVTYDVVYERTYKRPQKYNPHPPKKESQVQARVHQLHFLRKDKRPCPCSKCRTQAEADFVVRRAAETTRSSFRRNLYVPGVPGKWSGRIKVIPPPQPEPVPGMLNTVAEVDAELQKIQFGPPFTTFFMPTLTIEDVNGGPIGFFNPCCMIEAFGPRSHVHLRMVVQTFDREQGKQMPLSDSRRFDLRKHTKRELHQLARGMLKDILAHEVDESIYIDKQRIFDPHALFVPVVQAVEYIPLKFDVEATTQDPPRRSAQVDCSGGDCPICQQFMQAKAMDNKKPESQ